MSYEDGIGTKIMVNKEKRLTTSPDIVMSKTKGAVYKNEDVKTYIHNMLAKGKLILTVEGIGVNGEVRFYNVFSCSFFQIRKAESLFSILSVSNGVLLKEQFNFSTYSHINIYATRF